MKCPPAPPVDMQAEPVVGHVTVSAQPTPLVQRPYTIVLDDRIVAVVRNADSRVAANTLGNLDPATIESIEMVRAAGDSSRYPGTTGDILRIRRCYAATTRPN